MAMDLCDIFLQKRQEQVLYEKIDILAACVGFDSRSDPDLPGRCDHRSHPRGAGRFGNQFGVAHYTVARTKRKL